ncbi:hypothetical protein BDC45DRAFT_537159 [Circinella umbellata]|nr:hypothetical protein BDC45DRAFT_537159 [Circinella umbellata]
MVSEAMQVAFEQNDYDELNVLITAIQDPTIALNSNEWKAEKTQDMPIKHQSKNIQYNCAILNSLYIISDRLIVSILAWMLLNTHVGFSATYRSGQFTKLLCLLLQCTDKLELPKPTCYV